MPSLCTVEPQVIVNNIQIFSATQKWLYGTFMSSADNRTYFSPHVKCPVFFLSYSNQIWSLPQIFIKVYSAKFHGNPSSGSCADTRGRTDKRTETWTDMKLKALSGVTRTRLVTPVSIEITIISQPGYRIRRVHFRLKTSKHLLDNKKYLRLCSFSCLIYLFLHGSTALVALGL
jgi:hypothetical protein